MRRLGMSWRSPGDQVCLGRSQHGEEQPRPKTSSPAAQARRPVFLFRLVAEGDSTTVRFCGFQHPCLRSCVSTAPGSGRRSPQLSSGFHCAITRPQRVRERIITTPKATGGQGAGDVVGHRARLEQGRDQPSGTAATSGGLCAIADGFHGKMQSVVDTLQRFH
ncbi:unnamed protein product [Rangifer tarandus platyrhynchus]|uniref:Uncharacterized protein n=2 Tax=Rangifer tarandus platyrhynchus TaxID=3082113 RepID=A0ABN8YIK7_RANTA|nr:unnamed protein product [Rangifer tarandus platyrhynchus]CAI9698811.1 unnamed protein product [Rangifer tarandus platyrhynchus]